MSYAETVNKMLTSFTAGNLDGVLSTIHPECVFHESDALPYPGDWHGPEGFATLVGEITSRYTIEFDRYEVHDAVTPSPYGHTPQSPQSNPATACTHQ